MSLESPDFARDEPLDEGQAHEEANMLRAQLGISPDTGKIAQKPSLQESLSPRNEADPTGEDYDKALEVLDELRHDLKDESAPFLKGVIRFNQLVGMAGWGAIIAGRVVQAALDAAMGHDYKKGWRDSARLSKIEWENVFSDAESRLQRLRAAGEEFGGKEAQP